MKIERKLGDIILKERIKQNLSIAELAEKANITRQTIYHIEEHGLKTIPMALNLINALGIDWKEFWSVIHEDSNN